MKSGLGLYFLENKSNENNIVIRGPERNVVIPTGAQKIPGSGLFLGEQLVKADLPIKSVLEVGTGQFAPASFLLLASYPGIFITGVEIASPECEVLSRLIE